MGAVTINDQQQAFAEAYVLGDTAGRPSACAIKAGYSAICAKQIAYKLLRHDGVRAEIDRLNRAEIVNLSSLAIRRLRQILEDDKATNKIFLEAIKVALDRAGIVPPRAAPAPDIGEKEIAEMSIAELSSFVEEGRARIAADRRLIDVTPMPVTIEVDGAAG